VPPPRRGAVPRLAFRPEIDRPAGRHGGSRRPRSRRRRLYQANLTRASWRPSRPIPGPSSAASGPGSRRPLPPTSTSDRPGEPVGAAASRGPSSRRRRSPSSPSMPQGTSGPTRSRAPPRGSDPGRGPRLAPSSSPPRRTAPRNTMIVDVLATTWGASAARGASACRGSGDLSGRRRSSTSCRRSPAAWPAAATPSTSWRRPSPADPSPGRPRSGRWSSSNRSSPSVAVHTAARRSGRTPAGRWARRS